MIVVEQRPDEADEFAGDVYRGWASGVSDPLVAPDGAETVRRALRGGGAGSHEIAHCLRRARDLVAETGAKVLEPQVAEEEAWLDELDGNDRAATQKLKRARDLYKRIGAAGHVERLESELRD